MERATVTAHGAGWAVISLPDGRKLVERDLLMPEPQAGSYVGLPTDPRKPPLRLTPNYATTTEALQERDRMRLEVPGCEVFTDPGA